MESIRDLLTEELKDLYDAEKQLVKALPKMAKAASNQDLSQAFENHLEETRGHVQRLENVFEMLGEPAKSKPCQAMKGLIEEGKEKMQEDSNEPLRDSGIICAAQKVEHYEIAGYGTVAAWAKSIGLDEVADLLSETLDEEKAADEKLTEVASGVLSEAESLGDEATDEKQDARATRKPAARQGTARNGQRRRAKK